MRVDNPGKGNLDHGFGLGAERPEPQDVSIDEADGGESDGLFEGFGRIGDAALGGHVEIGRLDHDFGHDGNHEGLDGLHDTVQASFGLGFGDDTTLQEAGLHDSALHEGGHDEVGLDDGLLHDFGGHHEVGQDAQQDAAAQDLGFGLS